MKLKHPEAEVSTEDPWRDDVLGRAQIARRLTNQLRDLRDPFVFSIDGQWGTGKTFLLKRWQKELENKGFRVIYFNAWEDDFCDDPLLSIIGQLSEHFKRGKLKTLAEEMGKIAVPLLKKNALLGLSRATGLTFEVDLNRRDLLQEYRDQRQSKTELKDHLEKMSASAFAETGRPLVFIVDELDRCRPTFAIELLERVKHIFDVPGLVFVFGVNRDELCKALESVYGEIDATVYLRRFFDMEFSLPKADAKSFCESLLDRFRLKNFFHSLGSNAETDLHAREFHTLSQVLPVLCHFMGLSLRDIDYSVRLIAFVGKNLEGKYYIYPGLLSLLILLKFKNPSLYHQFIRGECRASVMMDYIDREVSDSTGDYQLNHALDEVEAGLYFAETRRSGNSRGSSALQQLRLLLDGRELTHPELLSARTRSTDSQRVYLLVGLIETGLQHYLNSSTRVLDDVAKLIDLHDFVRR